MNLYVGNIAFGLTEDELQAAFAAHGDVESARIITDRDTGRSKGFAFVEMPNDDQANEAMQALDGSDLNGRNIKVNQAKPKRENSNNRRY